MPHNPQKYFEDVFRAICEIENFCDKKTFTHFKNDRGLQLIVERELEIIGEALARYRKDFEDEAQHLPNIHRIIGLRNIIAHGYDIIDYEIIWDIVENKLPALKKIITKKQQV